MQQWRRAEFAGAGGGPGAREPAAGQILPVSISLACSGAFPSAAGMLGLQSVAAAFEANPMLVTDRSGSILWTNPAFGRLTGYAQEEVRGRNARVLNSGQHESAFFRGLWGRILQGQDWSDAITNVRRDGSRFCRRQSIVPVRDSAGRIACFFGVLQEDQDPESVVAALHASERDFRAVTEVEMHRAVEAERTRLARDLHDEVGASLTRIKVLAERMERDHARPDAALDHARRIGVAARAVADSLDEIVWAADPGKDRLENLGSYLIRYAEEYLAGAGLRFRAEVPEVLPDVPVTSARRHLVLCAFKESLNNVVKHARATEVRLRLALPGRDLLVLVSDNGKGLPIAGSRGEGSGLGNLRKRMADAGGRCRVWGRPGEGTHVALVLRLE